jgi:hypothetical protein
MTINNFAYLFILSILAVLIMWVFNAPIFQECYLPLSVRLAIGVSPLPPMDLENCLLVTAAFVFLLLTVVPIILILIIQGIFYIFKYDMRITQYILWAIWLGCVYFATQFHFITGDPNAPSYVWNLKDTNSKI